MQETFKGLELDEQQTELVCRGLLDLAAVDGVHESEVALIESFYSSASGESLDLAALKAKGFDLDKASAQLKAAGDTTVAAFLRLCFSLIWADGDFSDLERKRINEFAAALDVDAAALEQLHVEARLDLLDGLARNLRNKDVVQQVGQSLGLTAAQIATVGG